MTEASPQMPSRTPYDSTPEVFLMILVRRNNVREEKYDLEIGKFGNDIRCLTMMIEPIPREIFSSESSFDRKLVVNTRVE